MPAKFRAADVTIKWHGTDANTPPGHSIATGTDSLGTGYLWLFKGDEPSDEAFVGSILIPTTVGQMPVAYYHGGGLAGTAPDTRPPSRGSPTAPPGSETPTMLATQERVRAEGGATVLVWHKTVGRCDGQCDWHPIACSDTEGIVAPGPKQDVPLGLDKPGESWCPECLAIIRAGRAIEK